jgi:hypothetical protein
MQSYNIAGNWDCMDVDSRARVIGFASDEDLAKWAADPHCNQKLICSEALSTRDEKRRAEATRKLADLRANPFDARTEVSADARYIAGRIVKHLWVIFVVLPFVLVILFEILK